MLANPSRKNRGLSASASKQKPWGMRARFGCTMQHTAGAATTVRMALTVIPTKADPAVTDASGSAVGGRRTIVDSWVSRWPAGSLVDLPRSEMAMLFFSASLRVVGELAALPRRLLARRWLHLTNLPR